MNQVNKKHSKIKITVSVLLQDKKYLLLILPKTYMDGWKNKKSCGIDKANVSVSVVVLSSLQLTIA